MFFKNILIEFYYNIYLFIIFIFHFHPYCVLITLLHSFCQGNSSDVKLAGPFLSGMQALWSRDLPPAIKTLQKLLAIPFCQGEVPTNPFVKGMCGPLLAIQKVPHSHIKSGVGVHTPAMGIPPGHNGKALNTPLATLLDHIPPVIKQDLDTCPVQSLGLPPPCHMVCGKRFCHTSCCTPHHSGNLFPFACLAQSMNIGKCHTLHPPASARPSCWHQTHYF